jgi:hypothetical protein
MPLRPANYAPDADLPLFAAAEEDRARDPLAAALQRLRSGDAAAFPPDLPPQVRAVLRLLAAHPGEQHAVTGDALAAAVGIPGEPGSNSGRARHLRKLLEDHFAVLPVPICATGAGYFIPATEDEQRHYTRNLLARARAILTRARDYEYQLSRVGRADASPRAQRLTRAVRHLQAL